MCNKENNHRHQHYGRAETVMDDGHIQRPYSEVQTRVNVLREVFLGAAAEIRSARVRSSNDSTHQRRVEGRGAVHAQTGVRILISRRISVAVDAVQTRDARHGR